VFDAAVQIPYSDLLLYLTIKLRFIITEIAASLCLTCPSEHLLVFIVNRTAVNTSISANHNALKNASVSSTQNF